MTISFHCPHNSFYSPEPWAILLPLPPNYWDYRRPETPRPAKRPFQLPFNLLFLRKKMNRAKTRPNQRATHQQREGQLTPTVAQSRVKAWLWICCKNAFTKTRRLGKEGV